MTVMVASVIVMMMTIVRLGSGHHTVELTQRNLLTVRSNQGRCRSWKMQKLRTDFRHIGVQLSPTDPRGTSWQSGPIKGHVELGRCKSPDPHWDPIAKGTTDPRVEFILSKQLLKVKSQVQTQILIKFIFRISTKHQLLSQTSASPINLKLKIST